MTDIIKREPVIPVVAGIKDPIKEGIKAGWKIQSATELSNDSLLNADVIIIGTGAGGGTAAEILAEAGLKVLMLEEAQPKAVMTSVRVSVRLTAIFTKEVPGG